ncbi:unnamed protein product [Xylocopa violacea]|uniref:Uncharacterized protein n=1 Tax=Xylocopa violacea TaxID=135666 RepID=A0ABP1NZU3_XYLVO
MALKLTSNRSKSTSDILDKMVNNDQNPFVIENKYRAYTAENLREEQKSVARGPISEENKEQSLQKSQNFVKKLIASLEKKNVTCKADNEFFTKYYKRNDYSNLNSDYSFEVKTVGAETSVSNLKISDAASGNRKTRPTAKPEAFAKSNLPLCPNVEIKRKLLSQNCSKNRHIKKLVFENSNKEENSFKANEGQNKKGYCERYVQRDLKEDVDTNVEDEEKKYLDSSSFNYTRSRIKLQNQPDAVNAYFLKRNKNDHKRNTIERTSVNSKEEKVSKEKLNRSKSFKDFFTSMIKWKKSDGKVESRRIKSFDDLLKESKTFDIKNNKKLSRATSFQTVLFKNHEKGKVTQIRERNATIRPIYGGRRSEHLEAFAKKSYDPKHFPMAESMEDLVKPSAIKEMAKHISQFPQKPRRNNQIDERKKLIDKKKC